MNPVNEKGSWSFFINIVSPQGGFCYALIVISLDGELVRYWYLESMFYAFHFQDILIFAHNSTAIGTITGNLYILQVEFIY